MSSDFPVGSLVADFLFEPTYRRYTASGAEREELLREMTAGSRSALRSYALITLLFCLPLLACLVKSWNWRNLKDRSVELIGRVQRVDVNRATKKPVRTIHYTFEYAGKEYRAQSRLLGSRSYKPEQGVALLVDPVAPQNPMLVSQSDLLSVLPWLPECFALAGLFFLPWPIFGIERWRLIQLAQDGEIVEGTVTSATAETNRGADRVLSITFSVDTPAGSFTLRERRKSSRPVPEVGSRLWLLYLSENNCRVL